MLFWDDITITWDENIVNFLTQKKNCFGPIRSFSSTNFHDIIPKYRTKGHINNKTGKKIVVLYGI